MNLKRKIQIAVISDLHLGTLGCHAKELAHYLNSIDEELLILNGDIIDFWNFKRNYWPSSHIRVLELLMERVRKGKKVIYLTGNHDDILRKFSDFNLGNFTLADKLILELNGKKHWFFHGDILDSFIVDTSWLTKLGDAGYSLIILLNRLCNKALTLMGKSRFSLSKKIKKSVKQALKHVENFENRTVDLANDEGYEVVICGHIHVPAIKKIKREDSEKTVTYLNSGDWIENLSALEYNHNEWTLFEYTTPYSYQEESSFEPLVINELVSFPI